MTSGCFGGHAARVHRKRADARSVPASPPAADRVAFYQLATIIGALRSAPLDVTDAQRRLAQLSPRDPGLRELRDNLTTALARVTPHRAGARRTSLSATNAAYLRLLRYQHSHPAVAGMIPD
jgi:hypothetical protein